MSYPRDFYFQASSGEINGLTSINKFGSNTDIDTGSVPETVWSNGSEYTFASSSGFISVVSSSNSDNSGGAGALIIKVQGLNENYQEIEESFTMDGTSSVSSVSDKWLKVYRAFVVSAGSTESNVGTITITLGALTLATIPAEVSQTQMAIFAIPVNKKGYLTSITGSILRSGSNRSADLALYQRVNGVKRKIYEFNIETTGSTTFTKNFKTPLVFNEKTDIYVNVINVSTNNTAVFASFNVILQ